MTDVLLSFTKSHIKHTNHAVFGSVIRMGLECVPNGLLPRLFRFYEILTDSDSGSCERRTLKAFLTQLNQPLFFFIYQLATLRFFYRLG